MNKDQIIINLPSSEQGIPEYVRLPQDGEKEKYTGLSRSAMWRMIAAGLVESKVVKSNPKNVRGSRLVSLKSLLSAIRGEAASVSAGKAQGEPVAAGDFVTVLKELAEIKKLLSVLIESKEGMARKQQEVDYDCVFVGWLKELVQGVDFPLKVIQQMIEVRHPGSRAFFKRCNIVKEMQRVRQAFPDGVVWKHGNSGGVWRLLLAAGEEGAGGAS